MLQLTLSSGPSRGTTILAKTPTSFYLKCPYNSTLECISSDPKDNLLILNEVYASQLYEMFKVNANRMYIVIDDGNKIPNVPENTMFVGSYSMDIQPMKSNVNSETIHD